MGGLIEERLDMRWTRNKQSLWWTSTHAGEASKPMEIKVVEHCWVQPFLEDFDLLGYRYWRNGKCKIGVERSLSGRMNSRNKEAPVCRSKEELLRKKCHSSVTHVSSMR